MLLLLLFRKSDASDYLLETVRLLMLEKENRKLRAQINGAVPDTATRHGVPSFRTDKADMSFVEMEAKEEEDDDPTIECQTVCKFVRPNQRTSGAGACSSVFVL